MATIDVMLSDLPRVEYGEDKITQKDIERANKKSEELKQRMAKHGSIGANLLNKINTNSYLQSKSHLT